MRFDSLHGRANRGVDLGYIVGMLSLDVAIAQRFGSHPVLVTETESDQPAGSDYVDDLTTPVRKGLR